MLIRKEYIDEDAILGIRRINKDKEGLIKMLPLRQRDILLSQISKMRSESRIIEWLNTRVLLYELLGQEKIISNHPSGRPFLLDRSHKISISHTRGYVAILLSNKCYVGIDIETISDRISKVADKFISEDEYINKELETVHQLLHWSAKETLFKIIRESEVDFKEHLRVLPFEPYQTGVFEAKECKTQNKKTYQVHYEILEDAVLTWVLDRI